MHSSSYKPPAFLLPIGKRCRVRVDASSYPPSTLVLQQKYIRAALSCHTVHLKKTSYILCYTLIIVPTTITPTSVLSRGKDAHHQQNHFWSPDVG